MVINRKGKYFYGKTWSVATHSNVLKISLEHWIAFTYVINSGTVVNEAAQYTVHCAPHGVF